MTKSKKTDLNDKFLTLVESIVDDVLQDGVSLEKKLDALKVAGAYHVSSTKAGGKTKSEEDEANFENFVKNVRAVDQSEGEDDAPKT